MWGPRAVPNLYKADSRLSAMPVIGISVAVSVTPSDSLRRYFLKLALVQRSDSESSGQRSKIFGPPTVTLPWFGAGARGPGAPGVGVRCDSGLFSTHKSPNFILALLS